MVVEITAVVVLDGIDCRGALPDLSRVMKMFSILVYTGLYICQDLLNCTLSTHTLNCMQTRPKRKKEKT